MSEVIEFLVGKKCGGCLYRFLVRRMGGISQGPVDGRDGCWLVMGHEFGVEIVMLEVLSVLCEMIGSGL
jgi:hypothetical protein